MSSSSPSTSSQDWPPWCPGHGSTSPASTGCFAPNSAHRSQVTPAKRGKANPHKVPAESPNTNSAERHAAMTWAQRLKRVFHIDIETCSACGGAVKVIACIQDPAVIDKILTHRQEKALLGSQGPAAPKPGTACRPVLLTRQDPPCHQMAASHRARQEIDWPGKKVKV